MDTNLGLLPSQGPESVLTLSQVHKTVLTPLADHQLLLVTQGTLTFSPKFMELPLPNLPSHQESRPQAIALVLTIVATRLVTGLAGAIHAMPNLRR